MRTQSLPHHERRALRPGPRIKIALLSFALVACFLAPPISASTCSQHSDCNDFSFCTEDLCVAGTCQHNDYAWAPPAPLDPDGPPLREFNFENSAEPVPGSFQHNAISADGVRMTVETTGLRLGNAYTVWLGWFDNPEFCTGGPFLPDGFQCGYQDIFDPATGADFVYGSGFVATADPMRVELCRQAGDLPLEVDRENALERNSDDADGKLLNPTGAEYQTVVLFHGPGDPDFFPLAISTHDGACTVTFESDNEEKDKSHQRGPYQCGSEQGTGASTRQSNECLDPFDPFACPPF